MMRIQFGLSRFIAMVSCLLLGSAVSLTASERKVSLDKDWKFHLGAVKGAEAPSFDDRCWQTLHLPHDWSIEPIPAQREGITIGPFSRDSPGGIDTGQTLGGEGWYRKTFTISSEEAGSRFTLYFEGIYNESEIYVNGKKVSYNPYGYISFRVDITDYCNPAGVPNVIAVKAVNEGQNSRWYSGSGIYRHVWLIKSGQVHLDQWDTFIHTGSLNTQKATVHFSTIVYNKAAAAATGKLNLRILAPSGKEVYTTSRTVKASASGETPVSLSFSVKAPELWSVDSPALYKAEVSLSSEGKETDFLTVPFGIRTISFSSENGFQLNGKTLKLKGGCVHHDNGFLGAMAIDRAESRKVELMKASGYNAIRTAHNPPSESFLEACDRLGMLVIDESFDQWQKPKRPQDYHRFFDEWSDRDLASIVRRDRNHPCIIMWGIGNEIEQRADEPEGDLISKRLVNTVRKYDNTRFTTVGANDFWDRRHFKWDTDSYRAFQNVDVAGYNYVWWKYESDHASYPNRVIYGSESYAKDAALNWNLVEKHPYIIGDFVWTSVDYLGEAGLAHTLELREGERSPQFIGWPWYNAWCGDIDLCGEKKPQSYYRDIVWRLRDISLAVQPPVAPGKREDVNAWGWKNELLSWNWNGYEGKTMKVNIYSRSPKVRLYLNGRLLGEKAVSAEEYTATFEVPYEPGLLKAVNVDGTTEAAFAELRTAGAPAAIRLKADRTSIAADLNDLSHVTIEVVDAAGVVIPDCRLSVMLHCSGNGSVIASGNAAPDDMQSFNSLTPATFRGQALAILRPDGTPGQMKLTVSAVGMPDASVTVQTK